MPAAVRGEVGGAAEHLVALGTPVLDPDDAGALVLSQGEGIRVRLLAQLTHKLPQRLVPSSGLGPRLHLHRPLFDFETEYGRSRHLVLEVEFSNGFGFLGGGFGLALCAVSCGSFGTGPVARCREAAGGGAAAAAVAGADFQVDRGVHEMVQAGEGGRCRE